LPQYGETIVSNLLSVSVMSIRPLPICVAASLVFGGVPVDAQTIPLPSSAALPALAPPPGRIGRIASVNGAVSFHLVGGTEWQVASPNLPVTTGAALWVAPGAEAALGVGGGNRMVVGPATEVDVDVLDDQALAATQPQGESYLHLQLVSPAETYAVRTPRGTVTIATAGRYEIVSGDTEHSTTLTVLEGAATLTGIPTSAEIGPGQTLTVTGDGAAVPFAATVGPAVQDAFLRHVLAGERPRPARAAMAPAILAQMTGAEALDDVGEWSQNEEYGPVWYPPVVNYVPYRQGRWAYVAPWGWTWVDDAPWGFAPTHYGRWAEFSGRWGWVPGRDWQPDRRPVYAPALVGFFGAAALGYGRGPAVGWAPLGPRDAYRPPYVVNARITQVLNQPTGATIQVLNAPVTINRSAITIVPTQVLTNSTQVAGALRPGPTPGSIGPTAALQFRPQAVPTRATIGATQAVLRQVNPAGMTAPAAHIGPGPVLAQPRRPAREPASAAPFPSLNPAAIVGGVPIGAVAGGLFRPPAPRAAALPELRSRGTGPAGFTPPGLPQRQQIPSNQPAPGAISRPLPPVAPAIVAARGPGAIPFANRAAPGPILGGPSFGSARPAPAQQPTPGRPEPAFTPRFDPAAPRPHPEQQFPSQLQFRPQAQSEVRPGSIIPRPQLVAPPRQQIVTPGLPAPAPYRSAPPPQQIQHLAPPQPQQIQQPERPASPPPQQGQRAPSQPQQQPQHSQGRR
jgi:hypothetical protein